MTDQVIAGKTDKELGEEFLAEYKKLCEKHGFALVAEPLYMRRDDNSYSTVIRMSIAKTTKAE